MSQTDLSAARTPSVLRDPSRLAAIRRAALLDSPAEEAFDRLSRLAARLLGAPVALVTLVDEDRQFFKSCIGLPEPWASARETPLSHSFCQHVVERRAPLVISDAREHPLVRDNEAIRDLGVIAYLGVPLITPDGYELGSFCVIDTQPRDWSDEDVETVLDLAVSVLSEIELRVAVAELRGLAEAVLAPEQSGRARNHWLRDGVRMRRIEQLARESQERLHGGRAAMVDVAFHPRDVLWLIGKLRTLRGAVQRRIAAD